jgi:hypothetical protein
VLAHELEQLPRIVALTDDLETGALEQARKSLPEQHVVVGENDARANLGSRHCPHYQVASAHEGAKAS